MWSTCGLSRKHRQENQPIMSYQTIRRLTTQRIQFLLVSRDRDKSDICALLLIPRPYSPVSNYSLTIYFTFLTISSFSCRIDHVTATTERACESAWVWSAKDVESVRAWHAWWASALPLPPNCKAPGQGPIDSQLQNHVTEDDYLVNVQGYGC